jgi:hypothetical protein
MLLGAGYRLISMTKDPSRDPNCTPYCRRPIMKGPATMSDTNWFIEATIEEPLEKDPSQYMTTNCGRVITRRSCGKAPPVKP